MLPLMSLILKPDFMICSMWAEGTCWACSICSDNNLFCRILISCHLLSFSLSEMKIDWHITGNDSRRNSQFAFSIVSNVLCEIFKHGGVSEPAGILATSILVSAMSSVFSKIGWSLVYQNVTGRFMFLCASKIILFRTKREDRDLRIESCVTYTQNGSYPSCKPQVVKNFRVFTSCPNVNFAFWPTPRVKAGTKQSPCTSANEVSPPNASISSSPFREKPKRGEGMFVDFR